VPHVILKHETPKALLERIVEVFNKTFTTTLATTSYLGNMLKQRDLLSKRCIKADEKQLKKSARGLYDTKTAEFGSKVTKKVVAEMLQTDQGSASRYISS